MPKKHKMQWFYIYIYKKYKYIKIMKNAEVHSLV